MAEMVRKSGTDEIINHWIMAVSCILLIISLRIPVPAQGGQRLFGGQRHESGA
jgi:hypothetical protein